MGNQSWEDWMEEAKCASDGYEPEDWFSHDPVVISIAVAVCNECPVREPCLEFALNRPSYNEYGIWGGTTPDQRRSIKRLGYKRRTA